MLIKNQELNVRLAAVLALKSAAHNKPNLIKDLLPKLMPLLYDQTDIKKGFIHSAYLGLSKHVVGDAQELRKTAFEFVVTLLDTCLDQIPPSSFIVPHLKSGLADHYDVEMMCHLILSKLVEKCPCAVIAVVDSLVDPLENTIFFAPKEGADELGSRECSEDIIRSALRAVASLHCISGGDKLKNLIKRILHFPNIRNKYSLQLAAISPLGSSILQFRGSDWLRLIY